MSPALIGGFFTTEPPGKPINNTLYTHRKMKMKQQYPFFMSLPSMDLLKKHSVERLSLDTEFFMSVIIYYFQ